MSYRRAHTASHTLSIAALTLVAPICRAQCTPHWINIESPDSFFAPTTAAATWDPDGAGPKAPLLVIGGNFAQVGSIPAQRIIAWNGVAWTPLGLGINGGGQIYALADYNGLLIAAGQIVIAGGVPVSNIAAWNGLTWIPLGAGLPGAEVRALAVSGTTLFAGGQFSFPGGNCIAQWNGSSWASVGGGTDANIRALAPYPGGVVAGGFFTTAGGVFSPRAAWWNGSQWIALGSGPPAPVTALGIYQSRIIAGHFSGISQFVGSTWQPMGAGLSGEVDALTIYKGDLIAAGLFIASGPTFLSHIGRWNGTAWSALGGGIAGFPSGLAPFQGELIVVGSASSTGGPPYWARWTDASAPWIAAQPTLPATQPCPASDVVLTLAAATGYGTLSYQWRKNSVTLSNGPTGFGSSLFGATTPSLTISDIAPADAGAYDCLVSNSCAGTASTSMTLTPCSANCDCSSAPPVLNVNDFVCFLNLYATTSPYANCDASTTPPALNVNDFTCFLNRFAVGCN